MTDILYPVYNIKGEKVGRIKLLPEIFGVKINEDLLHQAVVTQLANNRKNIAHTKGRGDVRGGGRKPWRQKGTGRARHGSIRSPIWKGGGVAFGPTNNRVFSKKINKKMRRKAIFMALTSKIKDKEAVIVDNLEVEKPKTKIAANVLKNLLAEKIGEKSKKTKAKILLAIAGKEKDIARAMKNIPFLKIIQADSLNVLDLLSFKYFLFDKKALKLIESTFLQKSIKR